MGLFALLLLAFLAPLTVDSLTLTGQTVILNEIPYYVPAVPITTLPAIASIAAPGSLAPVTVVGNSDATINTSSSDLGSIIEVFKADDVWNEGFLEGKPISSRFNRL